MGLKATVNESIYPNNYLFYEDVKQFVKVYFVKAFAVGIRQSFLSPKFPVLQYYIFHETLTKSCINKATVL